MDDCETTGGQNRDNHNEGYIKWVANLSKGNSIEGDKILRLTEEQQSEAKNIGDDADGTKVHLDGGKEE